MIGRRTSPSTPKRFSIEAPGPLSPICIEGENDQGTLVGAFEDDGITGYLYIVDPENHEPVAACWLYNRIQAPPYAESLAYAGRGQAPPLPVEFKAEKYAPPRHDLSLDTIEVRWNRSGIAATAGYKNRAFGMLVWNGERWLSFSWLLNEPCLWGEPLTQDIFDRYARM